MAQISLGPNAEFSCKYLCLGYGSTTTAEYSAALGNYLTNRTAKTVLTGPQLNVYMLSLPPGEVRQVQHKVENVLSDPAWREALPADDYSKMTTWLRRFVACPEI